MHWCPSVVELSFPTFIGAPREILRPEANCKSETKLKPAKFPFDWRIPEVMLTAMKALVLTTALACLCGSLTVQAQYKAPSQYFRKDSPQNPGRPAAPRPPGSQPGTPQAPAVPQQPKFKDVQVNAQFYFLTDTNREYAWTKLSATTAKNAKNGATQAINAETPVQK